MPEPTDPGGGTTTNVCSASPADLAGQIDNIITRLELVEAILSQLLGVDISVIQLSDLSSDLGMMLSGALGSSLLGQLFVEMHKIDPWSIGGQDMAFNRNPSVGEGSTGDHASIGNGELCFGNCMLLATAPSTQHDVAGVTSGTAYRTGRDPFTSGFYITGRFGFSSDVSSAVAYDVPQWLRFFWGMHEANIQVSTSDYNNDTPGPNTGGFAGSPTYMGFQFSAPRGDSTFKIITRARPTEFGTAEAQIVLDTGMPVVTDTYYEMSMRCEAGGTAVSFTILNCNTNVAVGGSFPVPDVYVNTNPLTDVRRYPTYYAGFAIWNALAGKPARQIAIHHAWAQTLDNITPSAGTE